MAEYDVVVVGGGINGAAIARQASLQGLKVLLLEQADWASGASSKTSKLIHGGLRYLEHGQFGLVRESLRERSLLCRYAKPWVEPLPFIFPVYKNAQRSLWKVRLGLWFYDMWDREQSVPRHEYWDAETTRNMCPLLKAEGLQGACLYYDAQMDDARLVLENLWAARDGGAELQNYCRVDELLKNQEGRICGVVYTDLRRGVRTEVQSRHVVNVTGAWANHLLSKDEVRPSCAVKPSLGVHIVFPDWNLQKALILEAPQDHRVFFVMPWQGKTLVGTTDTLYKGNPNDVRIRRQDQEYLLTAVQHYFPSKKLSISDVIASFAGLRPLVGSSGSNVSAMSRDFVTHVSDSGLLSMFGGKYTIYRKMAAAVLEKLGIPQHKQAPVGVLACDTSLGEEQVRSWGVDLKLEADTQVHLWKAYGPRAADILRLVEQTAAQAEKIHPHEPYIWAELTYGAAHEMVSHADDWYFRRSKLGYSGVNHDVVLPKVAERLGDLLGWDAARIAEEIIRCKRILE